MIQFQENSQTVDPANTIYFNFDGQWHKLYFDGRTIFWRTSEEPEDPVNHTAKHGLVLLNLSELEGVKGHRVTNILYSSDDTTISASFEFEGGKQLLFRYDLDKDVTNFDG